MIKMKGKTVFKILLDVVMTVLYILLVFELGTGPFFHETVGIGIGVLFILHVILNINLIKGLRRSVINGKAGTAKKLLYYSDVFLPFGMFVAIITGVLISRVLFSFNIEAVWMLIYVVHKVMSYICLGILLGHVLLHAKYLGVVIKQMFENWRSKQLVKSVSGFAAIALTIYIAYSSFYSDYKNSSTYYPEASAISETVSNSAVITTASPSTNKEEATVTTEPETTVTLKQYLSGLICTGCHKRCPLSSPQCSKGTAQAAKATTTYNQQYGTTD